MMQADWRDAGELFGVNGHRIGAAEQQKAMDKQDSFIATLVFLPVLVVIGLVWWALRHPVTVALLTVTTVAWHVHGVLGVLAVVVPVAAALTAWRYRWRSTFDRFVTDRMRTTARAWWTYRRRWHATMTLTGLTARVDSVGYEPAIRKIRCGKYVDRLQVRMLSGQQPEHWDLRAEALAHTFGALSCRVRDDKEPGRIWLDITRKDSLAHEIPALPIPAADDVDLAAVRVGTREDASPWTIRLTGTTAAHLLIGGASGAGKSSLMWSLLRGVGPAIASGLVQVHGVDPKGGMELGRGHPLFTRLAFGSPQQWANLISDAEQLMCERTDRLRRAGIECHTPTVDEPLIILIIDEIASVTSYLADRQLAKQMAASLSMILTQGRAAGVVAVGAVQDPRKDIVPYRDLFTVRVGLRMTEANQVDMILGDGAHKRGAACEKISEVGNGTGYVLAEGHREPVRVRAAHVKKPDIDELVRLHPARLPGLPDAVDDRAVDAELAAMLDPGTNESDQPGDNGSGEAA